MIIKKLITYSFLLLLVLNVTTTFAQTDSLQVHQIKGKEYYIHIVKKGESLYAIGKKYDIPLSVIKKENPGVADGLSIDEKVFIPVKRNEEPTANIDGNFITHTVEKKQTLYSIAKLYAVKQKDIISANPELSKGLKEGQSIKIPVKELKTDNNTQVQPKLNYPTHTISKGETLYSLSKQYDVGIEVIKEVNGGLTQGLREGETIYIPIKKQELIEGSNQSADSSITALELNLDSILINKKPIYSVGLLLPFYLDENDEIAEKRNALDKKEIYPRSKFAIEFYNGFVKALNELSSDSCKFKIYVYDTKGNDTARIKSLLLKPEFKEFDFIVGPLYHTNFDLVADFAKEYKIPLISPVKQSNKILLGNPYIFKVIPSKTSIIEPIVNMVADSFKTENLLVVDCEDAKERALVDIYLTNYAKTLTQNSNDTNIYSVIKKINVTTNFDAITSQFSATKNNVVFIPNSNQSFVTSLFSYLITTLNKRGYEDYKVTLIGLEEWVKFENIDLDYFQRLNVHYCNPQNINEEDSLTQDFITGYIETNNTYPSNNSILGYDIGQFFGNYFIQYGTVFSESITQPYQGKSITIHFMKTGIESGFENKTTNLLRFYDYSIQKLR